MSSFFSNTAPTYDASAEAVASLPAWSPLVFGVILLGALVVTIMQAKRYFRDNPRDDKDETL